MKLVLEVCEIFVSVYSIILYVFRTPLNRLSISEISNKVKIETRQYSEAGVDGIIYENMHDLPYIRSELIGSEVISSMTRVCVDGVRELGEKRNYLLLGVQILAQGNKQAIAVAQSAGKWLYIVILFLDYTDFDSDKS